MIVLIRLSRKHEDKRDIARKSGAIRRDIDRSCQGRTTIEISGLRNNKVFPSDSNEHHDSTREKQRGGVDPGALAHTAVLLRTEISRV